MLRKIITVISLALAGLLSLAGCKDTPVSSESTATQSVSASSSRILAQTEGAHGFACQTDVKYPIRDGRKNGTLQHFTYPGTTFGIDVPIDLKEEVTGNTNPKYDAQYTHYTGVYTFDDTFVHGDMLGGYYEFSVVLTELEEPLVLVGTPLETAVMLAEQSNANGALYVWDIPGADFAYSFNTSGQGYHYYFLNVYKGVQMVTVSLQGDNLFPCDVKELYETVSWK